MEKSGVPRPSKGSPNKDSPGRNSPRKMIQPASSSVPSSPTRMKASPHGTPNKSPPETPTRIKASPSRTKTSPSYSEKKQRHSTPQITPKREKVPYNVTPNCSSGLEMSPRKDYVVGQDVLARWTDGLFYLGTVKKVDEKLGRCYILFEDQSSFWVMFKDMMGSPNYNTELTCTLCSDGTSEEPNQIVICDRCGQGYHQLCHQPPILDSVLEPEVQWLCRQCIFANSVKPAPSPASLPPPSSRAAIAAPSPKIFIGTRHPSPNSNAYTEPQTNPSSRSRETAADRNVSNHSKTSSRKDISFPGGNNHLDSQSYVYSFLQRGGALKKGPNAKALQQMKLALPYELSSLSWDSAHRTNKQECYCYCGGPGEFYLFVCSVCNAGPEYLQRMEMKW
ncbi:mitochondrial transcription factor 2 [Branchiostoma belcheri]|nr:mitochondrial transcription factor 2 [Branchiostoma belcheri]